MSTIHRPPSSFALGYELDNGTWIGMPGEILMSHSIDAARWFMPFVQQFPRWTSIMRVFKLSLWLAWVLYCWAVTKVYQTSLTSYIVNSGLQKQLSSEQEMLRL
ncbi:hypothetical protein C0J52_16957 [Blattella germanica]|nr:hypothetical protein C0J52_16957 [Blattella germanica]